MQNQDKIWGRRVLGLIVVAWLAVIVQPCAMAMGVESDSCPHCPPQETAEKSPCEELAGEDCTTEDQVSADSRSSQSKLKNNPTDLLAAIPTPPIASAKSAYATQCLPDAAAWLYPGGPPLNVLYCVYLK